MARPKKEEMYRNHRITVRFTETEFSIIETAAKQANMPLASYVRTQVLKGKVQTKIEIVADDHLGEDQQHEKDREIVDGFLHRFSSSSISSKSESQTIETYLISLKSSNSDTLIS